MICDGPTKYNPQAALLIATETPFNSTGKAGARVAVDALLFATIAFEGASEILDCNTPNSPGAIPGAMNGVGEAPGLGDGVGDGLGDGVGLTLGVGVADATVTGISVAPVRSETVPDGSLVSGGDRL